MRAFVVDRRRGGSGKAEIAAAGGDGCRRLAWGKRYGAGRGGKTLSAVTVTANAEPPPPDGLRATKTRVGRVEQDPHDLPQSIVYRDAFH